MGEALVPQRAELSESARLFAERSMADNTRRAYAADWQVWQRWCELHNTPPLPADPVALADYVAEAAGHLAMASIDRALAAIGKAHQASGHLPPGRHPLVAEVLDGIRRAKRGTRRRQMRPLLLTDLRRVIEAMQHDVWPGGVAARRDTAVLLIGFAGAFRRSELSNLTNSDFTFDAERGLQVLLRHSKTDQEGNGLVKAIPFGSDWRTCAPCAWIRWTQTRDAADRAARMRLIRLDQPGHICRNPNNPDNDGPAFCQVDQNGQPHPELMLSGPAIYQMVRRRISRSGLAASGFGSHSLRAGFVTLAARNGASDHEIMHQTGHKRPETVHIYVREHNPFEQNAVTRLGL